MPISLFDLDKEGCFLTGLLYCLLAKGEIYMFYIIIENLYGVAQRRYHVIVEDPYDVARR